MKPKKPKITFKRPYVYGAKCKPEYCCTIEEGHWNRPVGWGKTPQKAYINWRKNVKADFWLKVTVVAFSAVTVSGLGWFTWAVFA